MFFSVLCLFGVEYTISYSDPKLFGYDAWLSEHDGRSPLYDETIVKHQPFVLEGWADPSKRPPATRRRTHL
jgi:hypothetical protein